MTYEDAYQALLALQHSKSYHSPEAEARHAKAIVDLTRYVAQLLKEKCNH